ncbi:MAG: hypothetical protein KGH94_02555 [Candidatus Micrarchaeota archaeon]|nr:hypothetical protein [Candidatus Micrarchaeota archaeon]
MARTLKDTPKAKNLLWTLRETEPVRQQGGIAYQKLLAAMKRGNGVETEGNSLTPARA